MPYTIEFPIASGDRPPPPNLYRALHANLLGWMNAADSNLAAAVHDRPVRKPFTVSPLARGRGNDWSWRVTLLQDDLWEPLWTGVQAVGALDLNGRTWPVRWLDAHIAHRSYQLLLTNIRPAEYIRVAFCSPTTFSAGKLDLPLPEPGAVFHSWLSRWNDFAPPDRRISTSLMDTVRSHVAIAAIRDLRTERHDLGRGRSCVGFVGEVTFVITKARRLNQALVWQLNALADYAEFCGTGRKTTYGMGQTRRIHRDR
jgi:CRISPR-associated endoribonuclease Cas6